MQTMIAAQRRAAPRKRNPWSPGSVGPKAIRHTAKAAQGGETTEQREGRLLAPEFSLVGLHDTQVPEITGNSDNMDYTGPAACLSTLWADLAIMKSYLLWSPN